MCTLTYYPSKEGSIITANRDESPLRNAKSLTRHTANGTEFFIAAEPSFGGTNIAIGENGKTVVLLNGAFEPHEMKPYPGMSRGLLVLKSLEYDSVFHFLEEIDLSGIEPFTLVDFMNQPVEIRWDGKEAHVKSYDGLRPLLWASAQLYSKEALGSRQEWFGELVKDNSLDRDELWSFHHNAGNGDESNDLVMNRLNLVRTVSITQVEKQIEAHLLRHHNLLENTSEAISLKSKQ